VIRPTQTIIHVPLLVNRFQKKYFTYRSIQIFKILFWRYYSPESDPPQKIMRYWFYYSIQLGGWKWFLPQLYQFGRGIWGGPALKYFYMIYMGGRSETSERLSTEFGFEISNALSTSATISRLLKIIRLFCRI